MNPYMLTVFAIWKTCEFGGKLIRGEFSDKANTDTDGHTEPERSESPAFCVRCEIQNPEGSRYCSECGSRLAGGHTTQ